MTRSKFAPLLLAWHGISAGIYWRFLGLASSILVFWHLQCCGLLSGLVCVALNLGGSCDHRLSQCGLRVRLHMCS